MSTHTHTHTHTHACVVPTFTAWCTTIHGPAKIERWNFAWQAFCDRVLCCGHPSLPLIPLSCPPYSYFSPCLSLPLPRRAFPRECSSSVLVLHVSVCTHACIYMKMRTCMHMYGHPEREGTTHTQWVKTPHHLCTPCGTRHGWFLG